MGNTKPIRENYSHAIANAKKAAKRKEAEKRQTARCQRSDEEQIEKLDKAGHVAQKERARLQARK